MEKNRIRHTVIFNLHVAQGTTEAADFMARSTKILAAIPGVERFEALCQVSAKSDYDYSFSMEFATQDAYDAYNQHPIHTAYVADIWLHEVKRFMELDFHAV